MTIPAADKAAAAASSGMTFASITETRTTLTIPAEQVEQMVREFISREQSVADDADIDCYVHPDGLMVVTIRRQEAA